MAAIHRMTPARRAALRKAQLASARKRRRSTDVAMYNQKRRRASAQKWQRRAFTTAKITGTTALVGYGAYKLLTPTHRKYVDKKIASQGQKIKSKVNDRRLHRQINTYMRGLT